MASIAAGLTTGTGEDEDAQSNGAPMAATTAAPTNKKKLGKLNTSIGPGKRAGSPASENSVLTNTPSNSAGSSLKLTLPGKKSSDTKAKRKAGSPDVPVSISSQSSTSIVPGNAATGASNQPTAAQQAIMRKTGPLPKAKLKNDVKLQVQPSSQGTQRQLAPAGSQGQSVMQLPSQNPQARTFSPMPGHQLPAQQSQQAPPGQQGQTFIAANPQQAAMLTQAQQTYMSQLQVQGQMPRPVATGGGPAIGAGMSVPINGISGVPMQSLQGMVGAAINGSSPFQQPLQLPQQAQGMQQSGYATQNPQQQQSHQFLNIHRSPQYVNSILPSQQPAGQAGQQQQGSGYNPYQPASVLAPGQPGPNPGQGQQSPFTPQQAMQLGQLQMLQQQQSLLAHQQALQNHVSSIPQNFGHGSPGQGYTQAAGSGTAGQPAPAGIGQPQFNANMLNQLRAAQEQSQQMATHFPSQQPKAMLGIQQSQWTGR